MIVHYFTLQALTGEFKEALVGSTVDEVFSQQKNELCVVFSKDSWNRTLCVSVEPGQNSCVLREDFSRAKKNSVNLFQLLIGKTVTAISLHLSDRILSIHIDGEHVLSLQLYNTVASNIVLRDSDECIVEVFKREKGVTGRVKENLIRTKSDVFVDRQRFGELLHQYRESEVLGCLKRITPILGTVFSMEALYRAAIDEQKQVGELTQDQIHALYETATNLLKECQQIHPVIYYMDEQPRLFSIIPLKHCQGMSMKSFGSVNEAVAEIVGRRYRIKNFEEKKRTLRGNIVHVRARARRTVDALNKEITSSERAIEYEQMAHSLMANINEIVKGRSVVEMMNIFDTAQQLRITLDPSLTPYQNAKLYFEKARKAKQARVEAEKRVHRAQEQLALLDSALHALDACKDQNDLKEFTRQHEGKFVSANSMKDESTIPFRIFRVAGGYEVWVGKSAANNDLLTMKYAKPNDYWFHARGASGSHTVLKLIGGNSAPSREALAQTASIAAYYSKMRNAKNVPVSYCQRKYLHKSKHAEEGAVVIEREEVLFVEPHLP